MRIFSEVIVKDTSLAPGFYGRFIKSRERGNRDAARYLQARCRENVSQPWPPAAGPFDFPRLRTGRGKASIQVARIDEGPGVPASYEVFVAPPNLHLAWLELGEARAWDRVTPIVRQWLQPTKDAEQDRLDQIQFAGNSL